MRSTDPATPLVDRLDKLTIMARRALATGTPISLDATAGLFAALQDLTVHVRELETQCAMMEAVARDIDLIAHAKTGEIGAGEIGRMIMAEDETLKAQQRVLQAQLDEAGPDDVPRSGAALVRLVAPIGDTNVVTFPLQPRPIPARNARFDCQGDGGDAA